MNATAIVAAIVGSIAGGIGHYLLARGTSRANRSAMLRGLTAEIDVLHRLLRMQFGRPSTAEAASGDIFPIAYHGEIASVYDALSARMGDLDPEDTDRIVRFHMLYKTIVGVAEKRGPAAVDPALIRDALALGDAIVTASATVSDD